jgi:chemotaxis protein CheX
MAGAEVMVRAVSRTRPCVTAGNISAVLELKGEVVKLLVLSFPEATAAALAVRMLAGVTETPDDSLIRDCVGEMANVIAGQAKAMLAGTPYRFAFSVPRIVAGTADFQPPPGLDNFAITLDTGQGEFTMFVFVKS